MKRVIVVAVILSFMFLTSGTTLVFADGTEESGKDLFLAVGVKAWYNEWTSSTTTYVSQGGANVQSFTSDPELALIPTVSLKYKKFLISGGYMLGTDYDWPGTTDTINIGGSPYTAENKSKAEREELDINVGYSVHSNITLTLGYKQVKQDYTTETGGVGLVSQTTKSETKYTGQTIGIMGSAPIAERWGIYANLAYGLMDVKYEGSDQKDDATYISSELGFAYVPVSGFVVSFGYKYQIIDTAIAAEGYGDQKAIDVTKGVILGANYIF
jgi:hypothetical protein